MEATNEGLVAQVEQKGNGKASESRQNGFSRSWDSGLDEATRNQFETFFSGKLAPLLKDGGAVTTSSGVVLSREISENCLIPNEIAQRYVVVEGSRFTGEDPRIKPGEDVHCLNTGLFEILFCKQLKVGAKELCYMSAKGKLEKADRFINAFTNLFLKEAQQNGSVVPDRPETIIRLYLVNKVPEERVMHKDGLVFA